MNVIAREPRHALPYVGGQSTRFKAEPTKLTGVALRVMSASGNFGARRAAATSRPGVWFAALGLLLGAAAVAINGSDALTGDRSIGPVAAAPSMPTPARDHSSSVAPSVAEQVPDARLAPASELETATAAPPLQETARVSDLDPQDLFEIDRFHRRAAAAVANLAPAAGPMQR